MKKRHILYIPKVPLYSIKLPKFLDNDMSLKNHLEAMLEQREAEYVRLCTESFLAIENFKNKYKINKVLLNGLKSKKFKNAVTKEIEDKTFIGRCIDMLLNEGAVLESVEHPFLDDLTALMLEKKLDLHYPIFNYLTNYLQKCQRAGKSVSFLTNKENQLLSVKDTVLTGLYPFESYDGMIIPARLLNLPGLTGCPLIDLAGELNIQMIDKSLKPGENAVAILAVGDNPLHAYKNKLKNIKIHGDPHSHTIAVEYIMRMKEFEIILSQNRF